MKTPAAAKTYIIDGKIYNVVPLPRSAGYMYTSTGRAAKKMKRTAELFGTKTAKITRGNR